MKVDLDTKTTKEELVEIEEEKKKIADFELLELDLEEAKRSLQLA